MADSAEQPSSKQSLTTKPHFKYCDIIMTGFVTVLLCSNLIGPAKVCELTLPFNLPFLGNNLSFGAGNLFFPIGYIFGDILTEVYGYARARKVIWAGFFAMIFASVMSAVIIGLPPDPNEPFNTALQPSLEIVFGNTYRIVIGSIIAFWAGDFANSFVLAKMKILTKGRFLWMRTIGSTVVGQGVDSLLFYPMAFAGIWSAKSLFMVILFNFLFKVTVEVVMTPVTYLIVNFLKRKEQVDVYDINTDFTPFTLRN